MDDLLADFLTETNESLADLDVALVKLEQTPDDAATLQLIFRLVHTIKGTCGFLGLPRLEHVAHAAENVLGKVRDKVLVVTPDLVTAVLSAIDCIKLIIAGIAATEAEPEGDDSALIASLNAVAEGQAAVAAPLAPPQAPEPTVAEVAAPVAEVVAPVEALAPEPPVPAQQQPPAEAAAETNAGNQTLRVGVDVLEELMTLVSELVLTRNQLLQLARTQDASGEGKSSFTVPLQRLSHITTDLQEGVMKTRMQPISEGNRLKSLNDMSLVRDLPPILPPIAKSMPGDVLQNRQPDTSKKCRIATARIMPRAFWPGEHMRLPPPASTAPLGRTRAGLPVGVQVVGPFYGDRTTLAVARSWKDRGARSNRRRVTTREWW